MSETVVIGLSSGVDSSVAALLLQRQGYRVIGVTFALAQPGSSEQTNSCCSPTLMGKAKAIADHLGIPHYAVDKMDEFRNHVVDYFVSEYALGRTPNPCAKCNARVRFTALADLAQRLGADAVATGHYARLAGPDRRLSRGTDPKKDQSYVLAEVEPSQLERCLFPLGDLTKSEVRELAAEAGLSALLSEESQEICFVSDDYRDFLKARLGERPGNIVDTEGHVVGSHQGTYNFTVGQRKGLGLGGGQPLYVYQVDAHTDRVMVAPGQGEAVQVICFSLSAQHRASSNDTVSVQFRSMGGAVSGRLVAVDTVVLDRPTHGIAPGQTLVVYRGEDVVLGGTIVSTSPAN